VAGAVADYDRAIELKPDYSLAFANRGEFRRRQGDWAGALADFNRALEIEPVAIAFNNRALLMHAKGDLAAARADLDQAIKLKPDEAEFFRNRGQIRLLSGDLDGGLADAEQALGLRPDWVEACNLLAEIQRKKGDLDRALENFSRVIAKTPAFGPAYNGRGLAKFARGEYAEALADLDAAVRLLPNVPLVYNNRSTILQAMGELDRAHTDCLKALELKPDFADAKQRLTVLFDLIVNRSVEAAAANAVGADGTDASVPGAPAVRTDFSNEKRWRALCSAVKKGDNDLGAEASVEFVSDKKYEGWTPAELLKVYDDVPNASFLLVIDTKAIQSQGYPILVVDLKEEPGRRFRVSASDLWMVENNLSIGNMDFSEFVDHLDEDGVFRGFPG
jgi:tetratricopeptide (TPR) repeat protein